MVWYTYGTVAVYDAATDQVVENATGGKFRLAPGGADQPMQDQNGTTITSITSNASGQSSVFKAQSLYGVVQFGSAVVTVWANEVADKLNTVDATLAAAQAALADAQALLSSGGGGGLPAGTTLQSIPDGSTRLALLSTERLKLAGVAAGATALAIGTTAVTAKAGNYAPTAAEAGAVANLGGFPGIIGRTYTQGIPTTAELASIPVGTYIAVDAQ